MSYQGEMNSEISGGSGHQNVQGANISTRKLLSPGEGVSFHKVIISRWSSVADTRLSSPSQRLIVQIQSRFLGFYFACPRGTRLPRIHYRYQFHIFSMIQLASQAETKATDEQMLHTAFEGRWASLGPRGTTVTSLLGNQICVIM